MENNDKIKEEVLEDIKCGSIKMCPKWHFWVKSALFFLVAFLLLLTLLTLVGFSIFSLRQTGAWLCPVFTAPGLLTVFKYLPWIIVTISALVIIALLIVLRHYSLVSKKPVIYSLLAILFVATIGGIATAPLHKTPFQRAENDNLPFFGPIYMNYSRQMPEEINRGVIYQMATSGFSIKTDYGEDLSIILLSETLSDEEKGLTPGDRIMIFGRRNSDIIQACGINRIPQ